MAVSERDSFDPVEYIQYLRARWKIPVATVALGILVAAAICFFLTKQYTATATLVIEPQGIDPRAAIAVSPIYLESLKSYESYAGSDSLFAKTVDKFHLARDAGSIESLKRHVLRVEKLKDTKLLEIAVTLPDPKQAQAVVQYMAEETVALDNTLARSGDKELLQDAELKLETAQRQIDKARAQSEAVASAGSETVLESDAQALADLKGRIAAERIDAGSMVAESLARGDEASVVEARARLATLDSSLARIQKDLGAKSTAVAALRERRQHANAELHSAEEAFETARKRANDASNTVNLRTGQLHIVDPGIVPQRPSFPNLALALLAAAFLSAAACLLWLTAQFGFASRTDRTVRTGLKVASGGGR